ELYQLISINPHIASSGKIIAGQRINLPSSSWPPTENRVVAPFCPPVPQEQFIHTWIPLTSVEQMAATEYDVLIVGSGAGGGAALWRLCEQLENKGKRIGVVER